MRRNLLWAALLSPWVLVVLAVRLLIVVTVWSVVSFKVPLPRTQVVYLDAHYTPSGNIQTLTHEVSAWVGPTHLRPGLIFPQTWATVRARKDRIVLRERVSAGARSGRVIFELATRYEGATFERPFHSIHGNMRGQLWPDGTGRLHWSATDSVEDGETRLYATSENPRWHKMGPREHDLPYGRNPTSIRGSLQLIVAPTALYEFDHRTGSVRLVEGVSSGRDTREVGERLRDRSRKQWIESAQRELAREAETRQRTELTRHYTAQGHSPRAVQELVDQELGERGITQRLPSGKAIEMSRVMAGTPVLAVDRRSLDMLPVIVREALLHPGVDFFPPASGNNGGSNDSPEARELNRRFGQAFGPHHFAYLRFRGKLYEFRLDTVRLSDAPGYRPIALP